MNYADQTRFLESWWNKHPEVAEATPPIFGALNRHSNWYLGFTVEKNRQFLFKSSVSSQVSPNFYSSDMIKCYESQDTSGSYLLHFVLLDDAKTDVFSALCNDLQQISQGPIDDGEAIKMILSRYLQWKEMLKNTSKQASVYQGLYGELYALRYLLQDPSNKPEDVVQGWTGPDGEKQDFVLPSKWVEVKTVLPRSSKVKITSLAQLDRSDLPGELIITKVDLSEEYQGGYESVGSLYRSIMDTELKLYPVVQQMLDKKMFEFKYIAMELNANFWFKYLSREVYSVDDSFPKLPLPPIFPSAISSVEYTLLISGLEPWKIVG